MQNCAQLCKNVQKCAELCKTVQLDRVCKTVQLECAKLMQEKINLFSRKCLANAGEGERRRTEVSKDNRMQNICTSVQAKSLHLGSCNKVCTLVHAKKCKMLNYFRNAGGIDICILCLFRAYILKAKKLADSAFSVQNSWRKKCVNHGRQNLHQTV